MKAKEINLKEWYDVLKRRIWIIAVTVMLFTMAGAYLNSQPFIPLYEAETRIIIRGDIEQDQGVSTILAFLREPIVMERVIGELELQKSPQGLRNQIALGITPGSQIVRVSVIDPDPVLSAEIVNALIVEYKRTLTEFLGWSDIVVMSEADPLENRFPINSKSNNKLIFGFIAGMVMGVGAAFLRESLDDTVRSRQDFERLLAYPVLGHLSKISKKDVAAVPKPKAMNVNLRGETIGS